MKHISYPVYISQPQFGDLETEVVSHRDVLASNATGFVVQVIYLLNLGINKNSNFQLDCILYDISQNPSPSNQPHLHLNNEKTLITFHYTGCFIGIPMIGYNKPYNKW